MFNPIIVKGGDMLTYEKWTGWSDPVLPEEGIPESMFYKEYPRFYGKMVEEPQSAIMKTNNPEDHVGGYLYMLNKSETYQIKQIGLYLNDK
jgi:hypothetical protein